MSILRNLVMSDDFKGQSMPAKLSLDYLEIIYAAYDERVRPSGETINRLIRDINNEKELLREEDNLNRLRNTK